MTVILRSKYIMRFSTFFPIFLLLVSQLFAIMPAGLEETEETVVETPVKQPASSGFDLEAELAKLRLSADTGPKFDDDVEKLLANVPAIPVDKSKWLFIIGIEHYDETDNVKYSKRSAELFKKVAQKTLGIDDRRTIFLVDGKATSGKIKDKLDYLVYEEIEKGDTIYFYYNGHGVPDPATREPFILPSDKNPDYVNKEEEFKLKNIYKKLSDSKAGKVVAFIDSCFSGATDDKTIFKGVAAPRLKAKSVDFNKKKMVVLTAGKDKQFSNMYADRGHRLFSYFLMKSLINGDKTIEDLYMDVRVNVKRTSKEFGPAKKQEPTIDGNFKFEL